jgi:hypothetical protein
MTPKAGQRHRGRCRRPRHFGILHLSPVPVPLFRYRTGSCLGIFVHIPVPGLPDAGQSGIPAIRKLYESGKGYTLHVQIAGGEKGYTLHAHTRLLLVLSFIYDVEN